jgi:hypothetical protein
VSLFAPAEAHLDDRSAFLATVTPWMQPHRDLIEEWRHYADDKRGSPGLYLGNRRGNRYDPFVVGFFSLESVNMM